MKDKQYGSSPCIVKTSLSDKKASLHAIPSSVKGHKNPSVSPIGSHAMKGHKGK